MKDVCAMYSFGITAIAPNSEHVFISDKMLEELKSRYSLIKDVRGIGLMLGAELVKENGEAASEETDGRAVFSDRRGGSA